jgi:4-hydroxy-2-oxoheptanedioate aldolase
MQIWARSGIDALVIDMEHGPIGIESVHALVATTTGTLATPLVRIPWNVPWLAKPVLDTGAMGIMFPMIANALEAEAAVRSLRYPPQGERGWGPFFAPFRWDVSLPSYVEQANDELFTMVLIERPEAVQHIDEILKVPGIDMLLIAPFDLSTTMGYANQRDHPEVVRTITMVEEKILQSGIPLAGVALSVESAKQLLEKGYRGLFFGFDWMVLQQAIAAWVDGLSQ